MRNHVSVHGATSESLRVPSVRDLMNTRPVTVDPEMPVGEVGRLLVKKRVDGAAVVDRNGRFRGLVSTQGLMKALNDYVYDEVPPGPARSYLDADSPSLGEDAALMAAAQLFARGGPRVWAVAVLREEKLVGIATRLDVMRAVLSLATPGKRGLDTLYISALRATDEKPPY